jgi:hypothetical protein
MFAGVMPCLADNGALNRVSLPNKPSALPQWPQQSSGSGGQRASPSTTRCGGGELKQEMRNVCGREGGVEAQSRDRRCSCYGQHTTAHTAHRHHIRSNTYTLKHIYAQTHIRSNKYTLKHIYAQTARAYDRQRATCSDSTDIGLSPGPPSVRKPQPPPRLYRPSSRVKYDGGT